MGRGLDQSCLPYLPSIIKVQVIGVKGLLLHSHRGLSKLRQSASQGSNKTHKVNN